MKPLSLASRLALQITLTGAALVALLIALSYWVLVRQLELRAQEEVTAKLSQIDHGLLEDTKARMGRSWQHALSDTVLGHDNLRLRSSAIRRNQPFSISAGSPMRRSSWIS